MGQGHTRAIISVLESVFCLRRVMMLFRYKEKEILAHRGALKVRSQTGDP